MTHFFRYIALAFSAWIAAGAAARDIVPMDFGWTFIGADSVPVTVDLPHDFQIHQPWIAPGADEKADNSDGAANVKSRLSSRGFKECGKGTYRSTLHIPEGFAGKRLLLDFGGIMLVGDVFLNGKHVGGTDYGYLGFECDITSAALCGEDNTIEVTADTGKPENSRWYTGGGLYRGVKLVATASDLYFNRHGLCIETAQITPQTASITVKGDINARLKDSCFIAETRITDPLGRQTFHSAPVCIKRKWRNREYLLDSIVIENPMLWDCDTPNLYTASVTLRRTDGSVADSLGTTFGLRTIEYAPDFGFRLNGKKVLLKGIANHHSLGALGAAAYPRAMEKRIRLLKEFGFNHIRTSHNPYSEEFLDLCDRYGILVVDELYDKWLTQYAGGRKEWTELWQNDIPEWVRRDRNHPSVVMWSLGNELQGYSNLPFNDWGVTAYRLQKTLLDRYDTSRPATVAMHPRYRDIDTDSLPAPLVHETDIASYNYRYMYFPGDAARFPNLIFYQSEANLSNMGPNFFIPDNEKVVGLAYWGMIDYLGESLGWPAKGWSDGVFDISLDPKPNAWFLKSMFSDSTVLKLGVAEPGGRLTDWNGVKIGGERVAAHWNHTDGDTLSVYAYTNADEVELLLNGIALGRKSNDRSNPAVRNRPLFTSVPYEKGVLEAVAFTDGIEVARDTLATAGAPVGLVLEADNPCWKADGYDLQHIRITAVDAQGRRVPDAEDLISIEIDGPATLAAFCNGDITSDEPFDSTRHRLWQGRALAILRSTTGSGTVSIRIAGGNLSAECSLPTSAR